MHVLRAMKKMPQAGLGPAQTNAALLRLKARICQAPPFDTTDISISKEDAEWLAAEIEGGREAFQAVVERKKQAELRVKNLEQTVESMLALRDRLLDDIRALKGKIT